MRAFAYAWPKEAIVQEVLAQCFKVFSGLLHKKKLAMTGFDMWEIYAQ